MGRLEQNATIFFIVEEKETTGLKSLQKFFDYCIKNGITKNYKPFRP